MHAPPAARQARGTFLVAMISRHFTLPAGSGSYDLFGARRPSRLGHPGPAG
jgi:hypothetical protein